MKKRLLRQKLLKLIFLVSNLKDSEQKQKQNKILYVVKCHIFEFGGKMESVSDRPIYLPIHLRTQFLKLIYFLCFRKKMISSAMRRYSIQQSLNLASLKMPYKMIIFLF